MGKKSSSKKGSSIPKKKKERTSQSDGDGISNDHKKSKKKLKKSSKSKDSSSSPTRKKQAKSSTTTNGTSSSLLPNTYLEPNPDHNSRALPEAPQQQKHPRHKKRQKPLPQQQHHVPEEPVYPYLSSNDLELQNEASHKQVSNAESSPNRMFFSKRVVIPLIILFIILVAVVITFGVLARTRGTFQKDEQQHQQQDGAAVSPTSAPAAVVPTTNQSPVASPITAVVPTNAPIAPLTVVYGLQPDCFTMDSQAYNICLDLRSTSNQVEEWMQEFLQAKQRWEEVIVADHLQPVSLDWDWSTGETNKALQVDDLVILATDAEIDGLGGTVGAAAPAQAEQVGGFVIPRSGLMRFDSADIAALRSDNTWTDTVLHEMGHVLGIGTAWTHNNLYVSGEEYLGVHAQDAWTQMGCSGGLPVEIDVRGANGQHWDEQCLRKELMTGVSRSGETMKLSAMTVGTLEDMGYQVDYSMADSFTLQDLGPCGTACPESEFQQGGRVRDRRKVAQSNRQLSPDQRAAILQAAADLFLSLQSILGGEELHSDRRVVVYHRYSDGFIYDYHITWLEAKAFLERR